MKISGNSEKTLENHTTGDFMDLSGFEDFLKEYKFETKTIDSSVDIANEFDRYLSKRGKIGSEAAYEDLYDFSAYLIENKRNKHENYSGLLYFGYYTKNKPLIIASLEVIDGSEVMVNFSKRLTDEFGEEMRNEIFEGIDIPPLGMRPEKKPAITKTLIDRFLAKVDREKCVNFLADGLRDKYTDSYKPAREMYLKSANIDDFLKKRREKFVNDLGDGRNFLTIEFVNMGFWIKFNFHFFT